MQAGVLPVVHGSALAQHGLSQALVTSTIGDDGSAAKSEGITGETRQLLMVQLNDRVAAATEVFHISLTLFTRQFVTSPPPSPFSPTGMSQAMSPQDCASVPRVRS